MTFKQAHKLQDKAMKPAGFVAQLLEAVYEITGANISEVDALTHINALLKVLKASKWSHEETAFNTVYSRIVLVQLCEKIDRRALLAEIHPESTLREVCGCVTCQFIRNHPDVIDAARRNLSAEQLAEARTALLRGMLNTILEGAKT